MKPAKEIRPSKNPNIVAMMKAWREEDVPVLMQGFIPNVGPVSLPVRAKMFTRQDMWSEGEDNVLMDNPELTAQELTPFLPKRSVASIQWRRRYLSVARPGPGRRALKP